MNNIVLETKKETDKHFLILFLLIAVSIALTGIMAAIDFTMNENEQNVADPYIECSSLIEAEDIAGFFINEVKDIDEYTLVKYEAVKDSLIQLVYANEPYDILIRKAINIPANELSGDLGEYDVTEYANKPYGLTLKYNEEDRIKVVTFKRNGYSYSITTSSEGLSRDMVEYIIDGLIN